MSGSLERAALWCALLLALGAGSLPCSEARAGDCAVETQERRALWVIRDELVSPTELVRMVAMARDCHFTALLVQVRGRDDAYYESEVVPMAEPLRSSGIAHDPLRLAVEKGHEAGLEVHAWVNLCVAWSAPYPPKNGAHILYRHPEWLAQPVSDSDASRACDPQNSNGRPRWCFLSPAIPEACSYLLDVVAEIVQCYDIDGLHLDYVRYPGEDFDYGLVARRRFQEAHGVDPRELYESRRAGFAGRESRRLWDVWLQWRASQVTELVRSIREVVRTTKPELKLSAAVKPDAGEAYELFGQQWVEWVRSGLVDFVVPMMYARDAQVVMDQFERVRAAVPFERFYVGLSAHNQPLPCTLQKVRLLREAGVRAFSIFSYSDLKGQHETFVSSCVFAP